MPWQGRLFRGHHREVNRLTKLASGLRTGKPNFNLDSGFREKESLAPRCGKDSKKGTAKRGALYRSTG
jgi:hypothetical protein